MTLQEIKKKVNNNIGNNVTIKYNLGRNKYDEFDGTIIKIYNSLFLVKDNNTVKSFSFADVVTKIIKIYV